MVEFEKELQRLWNIKDLKSIIEKESFEKTASDIREFTGSGTTAKAVKLMYNNGNLDVVKRVNQYVAIGFTEAIKLSMGIN